MSVQKPVNEDVSREDRRFAYSIVEFTAIDQVPGQDMAQEGYSGDHYDTLAEACSVSRSDVEAWTRGYKLPEPSVRELAKAYMAEVYKKPSKVFNYVAQGSKFLRAKNPDVFDLIGINFMVSEDGSPELNNVVHAAFGHENDDEGFYRYFKSDGEDTSYMDMEDPGHMYSPFQCGEDGVYRLKIGRRSMSIAFNETVDAFEYTEEFDGQKFQSKYVYDPGYIERVYGVS